MSCVECNTSYIGESKNFPKRLRYHKNDVRKFERQQSTRIEHNENAVPLARYIVQLVGVY